MSWNRIPCHHAAWPQDCGSGACACSFAGQGTPSSQCRCFGTANISASSFCGCAKAAKSHQQHVYTLPWFASASLVTDVAREGHTQVVMESNNIVGSSWSSSPSK